MFGGAVSTRLADCSESKVNNKKFSKFQLQYITIYSYSDVFLETGEVIEQQLWREHQNNEKDWRGTLNKNANMTSL